MAHGSLPIGFKFKIRKKVWFFKAWKLLKCKLFYNWQHQRMNQKFILEYFLANWMRSSICCLLLCRKSLKLFVKIILSFAKGPSWKKQFYSSWVHVCVYMQAMWNQRKSVGSIPSSHHVGSGNQTLVGRLGSKMLSILYCFLQSLMALFIWWWL